MSVPIQKAFNMIGKYGCYLLCLLHVGHVDELALSQYERLLKNGWIDEECTVLDPCSILWSLTGQRFRVVKTAEKRNDAFLTVEYWYNEKTGKHHFTLQDWDPYGQSETRLNGKIESYRYFYLA